MKLEIEVDDIVEFTSAINNSIVALNNIYSALYLGCEIPSVFEKVLEDKFGKNNYEKKCAHLERKLQILKKFYDELEKKEKDILKNGGVAE